MNGSILLEALLSVIILSVSLVVIIQAITSSLRATVYSTQYVEAVSEIENKMAAILETSFQGGSVEDDAGVFENFSGRYNYTLSVADAFNGAQSRLQQIDLAVKWKSGYKNNAIESQAFILKKEQKSDEN